MKILGEVAWLRSKTNSASEEESVLHKRDSSEQADSEVKCKQGNAAGAKGVAIPVLHK
jgi:hypothetical protein